MKINTHYFSSTASAYAACQCDDNINDGDTLVIKSESVVGIASVWPIAVTKNYGALHTTIAGKLLQDVACHNSGLDHAIKRAKENGFELLENANTSKSFAV